MQVSKKIRTDWQNMTMADGLVIRQRKDKFVIQMPHRPHRYVQNRSIVRPKQK